MPAVVQTASVTASGGSASGTLSFVSNTASGNLIVVAMVATPNTAAGAPGPVAGVGDTMGAAYTQAVIRSNKNVSTGSIMASIWSAISKSGGDTITVSISGHTTNNDWSIFIAEVSGISLPIGGNTGNGGGVEATSGVCTNATSGATGNVTYGSGAFLIAAIQHNAGEAITQTSGMTLVSGTSSQWYEYTTSGITSPTAFGWSAATSTCWIEVGAEFELTSVAGFFGSDSKRASRRGRLR